MGGARRLSGATQRMDEPGRFPGQAQRQVEMGPNHTLEERVLRLLKAQYYGQAMYTSCGFFFTTSMASSRATTSPTRARRSARSGRRRGPTCKRSLSPTWSARGVHAPAQLEPISIACCPRALGRATAAGGHDRRASGLSGGSSCSALDPGRLLIRRSGGDGQREGKDAATIQFALCPDLPAMQLDQMLRDRQAKPGPCGV